MDSRQSTTKDDFADRKQASSGSTWPFVFGVFLVVLTVTAHSPAIRAGYIWDDKELLYGNALIQAADGLRHIWLSTDQYDYWPLTITTFWLEWRVWGDNPTPYHVGNILLHAISAVLLWRVLKRLGLGQGAAGLTAAMYAVHPVTVASVAWIAERKNVLSMALYLFSILAYLRFEEDRRGRWYAIALLAFAATLLAKTSVVMLPIVLLLCIWWKRGRLDRGQILRLFPFLAMSLVMGLVTIWFQHHHALGGEIGRPEGMASRIAASGWIVWFYLSKIALPIHLMMLYPRWDIDGGRLVSYLPLAALAACFVTFWVYRRNWGRGPLTALTYFVLMLAPALGFVDMAFMRYSLVADHLQYAAMPGMIALAAAGLVRLARLQGPGPGRHTPVALGWGLVIVLAGLTWSQARIYKDEETLWSHQIQLNDRIWAAYCARGDVYRERKDYRRGIDD